MIPTYICKNGLCSDAGLKMEYAVVGGTSTGFCNQLPCTLLLSERTWYFSVKGWRSERQVDASKRLMIIAKNAVF
jgi:hypothetical protein